MTRPTLRVLSASDVHRALSMREAVEAMRDAFIALAEGRANVPLRTALEGADGQSVILVMPASVEGLSAAGAKLVSVAPENTRRGLPLVHGIVVLVDSRTGQPAAVLDGNSLTAIRTGAASGLATELLARADAALVAVIGSGTQARTQLEAVCSVRQIEAVRVHSRTREHAEAFASEMAGVRGVPRHIAVAESAAAAVTDADVICVATTSADPVLLAADVPPGAHINAVGSFTRGMIELDPQLVAKCRVVVDQRAASLGEAGEIIAALEAGLITGSDLTELGELAAGESVERPPDEITLFKSVGLAVQDIFAAATALRVAVKEGLGTEIEL